MKYQIKRIKNCKSVRIRVAGNGDISITAPLHLRESEIQRIVEKNKAWIEGQRAEALKYSFEHRIYSKGELYYLGKPLKVVLNAIPRSKEVIILQEDQFLKLCGKVDDKKAVREALESWYKSNFMQCVQSEIKMLSQQMNVQCNKITLKNQKTRWGSCSSKGNINLNWRLAMATPEVSRYVIVHELSHLLYMNHSKKFWECVSTFDPGYKESVGWLKKYSHTLGW